MYRYLHILTLLFFLLVTLFVPPAYAQSNPPFNGIITCPGNPACPTQGASPAVTNGAQPNPTNSASTSPSNPNSPTVAPSNPVPNDPCTTASLATSRSRHWEPNGGISGFIEKLLRFFLELINKILELFGGAPIKIPDEGNPIDPPNQEPQNPNKPTGNPENPNPDPCEPNEPQPTTAQPTMPQTQPSTAQPSVPQPSGGSTQNCGPAILKSDGTPWQCTFQDEFEGTSLSSTWEAIPYGLGSACLTNDSQHARVAGGNLELVVTSGGSGCEYTGGGIQSQGKFAQSYGRFEMRAKFPKGDGFWPAFWLLPDDDSYDGEIDILESYGGRIEQGGDVGDFTLHVPAGGDGGQRTCRITPDYSSGFHTYTFEWTATSMRALYDGNVCADFTGVNGISGGFPATFSKPYHILINLAMQPWWPPTSGTPIPGVMQVDYVRVWK